MPLIAILAAEGYASLSEEEMIRVCEVCWGGDWGGRRFFFLPQHVPPRKAVAICAPPSMRCRCCVLVRWPGPNPRSPSRPNASRRRTHQVPLQGAFALLCSFLFSKGAVGDEFVSPLDAHGLLSARDSSLSLFHGLGKVFYPKRHPTTVGI